MKKVVIAILVGLLILPTNIVNAAGVSTDEGRAKVISKSIEGKTGVSDVIKSNLNEDIYTDNAKINLPTNGNDNVKINDLENKTDSLEMTLPKEAKNSTPKMSDNGTIVYNNEVNNSANIALQPTKEGIRSLVTINNLSASKEYTFVFKLPKGSKLITSKEYLGAEYDTKEVYVVNKANIITSIICPPWAKDANGSNVPTHYNVEGSKLIQVVEFTKNNAFPIVADPNWTKIAKCSASIAWAIGSGLFAVSKIIKIKKYMVALGGLREATALIVGTSSWEARFKAGGSALVNLAAELSGIAAIRINCF